MLEYLEPQTVELKALKLAVVQSVSEELINAGAEIVRDVLLNRIRLSVHGYVWAENESVKRQEIKYPRDWWQALKERWFPKWLLKKYPVDYHIVVLDVKAIYPTFKQALPDYAARLMIQRWDEFSEDNQ